MAEHSSEPGDPLAGWSTLVETVRRAGDALRTIVAEAAPHVAAWAVAFREANKRVKYWEEHAPSMLKGAIAKAGLLVPSRLLTLPEHVELLAIYECEGEDCALDRLRQHYDEIFGAREFFASLADEWGRLPSVERRFPLLSQGFAAHEQGLYAASVPLFIAQFEGLVVDLSGHVGRASISDVQRLAVKLARPNVLGRIFSGFVNETVFAKFHHGSPIPPFSRHAILHGGDIAYATETNSRTAILLIDELLVHTSRGGEDADANE